MRAKIMDKSNELRLIIVENKLNNLSQSLKDISKDLSNISDSLTKIRYIMLEACNP